MSKKKAEERKGTAYGYTRVSTEDQADSGKGLEAQKDAIENYYLGNLKSEGVAWGGLFSDPAVSGGTPLRDRKHGREMCDLLQRGDHVVVAKVDRAFRQLGDLCATLDFWLKQGVSFHVMDLKLDTSSPIGRCVLQILGAVAEFERRLAGQRSQAAREVALREGKLANGYCKAGFKVIGQAGHRKVVPDEQTQEVIRRMVGWRIKGMTWEEIYFYLVANKIRRREGNEWSRTSIQNAVNRWMQQNLNVEPLQSEPSVSPEAIPVSQCLVTPSESTEANCALPASSDPVPR